MWQNLPQTDERHIADDDVYNLVGLKVADVGLLIQLDPLVRAQTWMQLVSTDIHRNDSLSPVLEGIISKPAGTRANVKDHLTLKLHFEPTRHTR